MVTASVRKRAVDSTGVQDERPRRFFKGSCGPGKCRGETACQNFENNTYTCVCTHTSLPPTWEGDCPRIIVTQDKTPQKIPVQPLSENRDVNLGNYSLRFNASQQEPLVTPRIQLPETAISTTTSGSLAPVILALGLIFGVLILVLAIVFHLREKAKQKSQDADPESPIHLKNSLLLPERYTPNPQYFSFCNADVPVIRREQFNFIKELGEGCFGKVYKGELITNTTNKTDAVAIKVLKETANKEAEEDFFREVEVMSTFRHPNILSLLGVVLKETTTSTPTNYMMIFEYMEYGDLAEVLRAQQRLGSEEGKKGEQNLPSLSICDLLGTAVQIASGMEYLAAQRFVHRDLACRNCLMSAGPTVKIADFGMSRDVYTCDYYKIGGSRLLPVRWMSPESVIYGRFTLESDIWSYGVVLWEIYSYGKQPYYGYSNEEVVKKILDGVRLTPPENCPSAIYELMRGCWIEDPKERFTFSYIKLTLKEIYNIMLKENLNTTATTSNGSNAPKTLPRPPPLPKKEVLDAQGYLLPIQVDHVPEYLKTVCDSVI
ncbi:BDNF/NT-3 growth factors receptor-like [Anthonomus grandis grandis]|uniref:BDNF/NT-3 growth factors receptor-like n=1 Tax=Anthonomus grandis grandis TaxID=2921223 RepID=UPI0021659917|nr:BDNF/NT-3 growth factors receptor-like [Anthonomus grandis grandis]